MLITRPRKASGAIIWSAVLTPATATIEARPTITSTSAASHTRLTAERTQSPAHETPAAAASRGKVGSARLAAPRANAPVMAPIPIAAISSPNVPGPAFFFNDTATTEIYTLSLHDALPI